MSDLSNHVIFKPAFIRRKANIVDYNLAKVSIFQFSPNIFYSPRGCIDTVIFRVLLRSVRGALFNHSKRRNYSIKKSKISISNALITLIFF